MTKRKQPRKLNRPSNWKKQINVNTKRMEQLMRDVRLDVTRRTSNSKDIDAWIDNLSEYVGRNCFRTGIHAVAALEVIRQISDTVDQISMPPGSHPEIVKGTIAEACYTLVTNMGDDLKSEMQRIAVESYNQKNTPQQTAKLLSDKIESIDKTRARTIARTETCRAANLANYINAKQMGAKSYRVICNEGCCEYCQDEYGNDESGGVGDTVYSIEGQDNMPPLHPNCRCTPVWSMDNP